jgi:hypothetical protein
MDDIFYYRDSSQSVKVLLSPTMTQKNRTPGSCHGQHTNKKSKRRPVNNRGSYRQREKWFQANEINQVSVTMIPFRLLQTRPFISTVLLLYLLSSPCHHVDAFVNCDRPSVSSMVLSPSVFSSSAATTTTCLLLARTYQQQQQTPEQKSRRKELMKRVGTHFQLDRLQGTIEFGAAVNLVTNLEESKSSNPHTKSDNNITNDKELIEKWLCDDHGRGLAQSIWDEDLLTDLGDSVFRLQTMPLQFVTLQLQPAVDIQMWTQPAGKNKAGRTLPPIFKMQSLSFEPNLQILPGMSITAQSLGLVLEVVGDLRPSEDGHGVTGKICFQSTGILPPPLRLLPESALKLAIDTINDTVVSFAIASFQKGARQKYLEYKIKQIELNNSNNNNNSSYLPMN